MNNIAMSKTAIFTIVSNNYLHFARTMLQSARLHHDNAEMYCVIVDTDLSYATAFSSEFEAISLEKLNLPLGDEFLFQYSILELNTAVKPWAFEYLLECGHEKVIYIDPDIQFYGPMTEVEVMLLADVDIVLTPHLLAPVTDDKTPSELDIRRAGSYNFGFCALRQSANTRSFLRWWQSKLTRDCVVDMDRGLFVDQAWMDLVPGLFENVCILRHKGYNVAYWNLAQRPISGGPKTAYFIGDTPLVFFHFSGLDPFKPAAFSKHQNRLSLSSLGNATALVENYVQDVMQNGAEMFGRLKYGFGYFKSDEKVPDSFRKFYRESDAIRQQMGARPFQNPTVMGEHSSFFEIDGVSPTNAMVALWNVRQDLKDAFSLRTADSIWDYYRWFSAEPSLKELFSESTIARHQSILKLLSEEKQLNGKLPVQGDVPILAVKRVRRLYASLLNRKVDPQGFRIYSELCKTNLGYLRAWRNIAMSKESKQMPNLIARMLKALFTLP